MRFLHVFSGFFLLFELPVPIYWLILHPLGPFWRKRVRAAFLIAGLTAWICGDTLFLAFRRSLLNTVRPPWWVIASGFVLIAIEIYLFVRVERELGSQRLVGHAELTGKGEMFASGLYTYVRHPRYAGMFCGVAGAALLAGTPRLWIVLAMWFAFALLVIRLEERELATRFGASYITYRNRVPAFLPLNLLTRAK